MDKKELFVKTIDEEIANALCNSGFFYVKERINKDQIVYAFEATEELLAALSCLYAKDNALDRIFIQDSRLNF